MDILFWSGGKDSYLALEFYKRALPNRAITLLTTYEEETRTVPHQNIPIHKIKKQARYLNLKIHTVPLPADCSNDLYLEKLNKTLNRESPKHLLFGDWHLQDIRDWREESFNKLGYECRFPIWKRSLHELLPVLLLKTAEIRISAVQERFQEYIRIGELYNQHFMQQLPHEIDPMGERGEFHTEVCFASEF